MSNIKAITFDAGGTLISPFPSVGAVYAEVAREHGVTRVNAEALTDGFQSAWKQKAGFGYTIPEWEEIVFQTFKIAVGERISTELFQAIYSKFEDPNCWKVNQKLLALLPALKQRYKLGLISNWDSRLRPLLQGLGVASYFDCIVVSCEVGATKPSRRIFDFATEKLGVPAASILHVGDSQIEDCEGAIAAGYQAFHFQDETFEGLPLEFV